MKHTYRIVCLLIVTMLSTLLCSCSKTDTSYSSDLFYSKVIGDVFESADSVKVVLAKDSDNYHFEQEFYTDSICFPTGEYSAVKDEEGKLKDVSALYCITDNTVIYESNVFERVYPASITKLLTALLTLENCNMQDEIVISDTGTSSMPAGAKNCNFEVGEKITVEQLLYSLLIYSGNDAAYILATHISGSEEEFTKLMNSRANELFAVDTHFVNSHGLHKLDHYTTPYDMYLIFNECLKYDLFRTIVGTPKYTLSLSKADGSVKQYDFEQTNLFFTGAKRVPEGITIGGGKTGTTSAAGYCMILYFTASNGKEYICESFANYNAEDLYGRLTELMQIAENN